LGEIPGVDPGDTATIVSPAKIAGRLLVSNESIADSSFPIISELGRLIAESMAPRADVDLCYGASNPAAPSGFFDLLDVASGDTLRAAVVEA
jgi:hypothetical protein